MSEHEQPLRRTPLHPLYERYGARTIPFGGWELPVQFSGLSEEHHAVRQAAGLFDVSHMGVLELHGEQAFKCLQNLITQDLAKATSTRAVYTLMCEQHGGIIDDFLVYQRAPDRYLLIVNAANRQKDLAHMQAAATHIGGVTVTDRSGQLALLALQGPKAAIILDAVADTALQEQLADLRPFRFMTDVIVGDLSVELLSRTGYTGEDGFELVVTAETAITWWLRLMQAGQPHGLIPAGLGARDSLRLEACLPLYGNELTADITPIDAGLSRFVTHDKGAYVGREAIERVLQQGPRQRLVGLEMIERGIARHGYTVTTTAGEAIGHVTSGTQSPTLGTSIALAYVDDEHADIGQTLAVDIRGRTRQARVVNTPFYRRDRRA